MRAFASALVPLVAIVCGCDDQIRPLPAFIRALDRPALIARGGGGGERPEDTRESLTEEYANDPTHNTILDIVVRRTRDGVPVVIHDAGVDRIGGVEGESQTRQISNMLLSEVQAVDAARCFSPLDGGPASAFDCKDPNLDNCVRFPFRWFDDDRCKIGTRRQIRTLAEILDALPPDAWLSIKVEDGAAAEDTGSLLKAKQHDLTRIVIGSTDDEVSHLLAARLPTAGHYFGDDAASCFVLSETTNSYYAACPRADVMTLGTTVDGFDVGNRQFINNAHRRGLGVFFYTIDDPSEATRLADLAADGFITNFPDRIRATIAAFRAAGGLPEAGVP